MSATSNGERGRADVARVQLGRVVATPGALAQISTADLVKALWRHGHGDWGDVCATDRVANDQALVRGERILSAYSSNDGVRFWIITEADRSSTTILLPDEY